MTSSRSVVAPNATPTSGAPAARADGAPAAPIIVPPAGGRVVLAFANEILFKLTGEQTADALTLGLAVAPAGGEGPPPHVHEREDEIFIILEGRYRVWSTGEWSDEVGPGSVVFLPRGVPHTFRVVGEQTGRHWVLTTSGDFGRFYDRCGELFATPGPPDVARLGAIAAEHGMRFQRPGGESEATAVR